MSSFAYLYALDRVSSVDPNWRANAVLVADAKYRVPVLWLALLGDVDETFDDDEQVVFFASRDEAVDRLAARTARLAALFGMEITGYIECVIDEFEGAVSELCVDATEVAFMSEPASFVAAVRGALRWLDDESAQSGYQHLFEISSLEHDTRVRPADQEPTTAEERDQVLSLLGTLECG